MSNRMEAVKEEGEWASRMRNFNKNNTKTMREGLSSMYLYHCHEISNKV